MRKFLLAALAGAFIFGSLTAARAQNGSIVPAGDIAVTYQWVRTNATPGVCGCFSMNGAGISASWNLRPRWTVVVEASGNYAGNVFSSGRSLTLASYMGGIRYRVPSPWFEGAHTPQVFSQALFGGSHAGGGIAGTADGSYGFAARVGGGIDEPLNARFAVRLAQVDYFYSHYANFGDHRQNNLLVAAGLVFHW